MGFHSKQDANDAMLVRFSAGGTGRLQRESRVGTATFTLNVRTSATELFALSGYCSLGTETGTAVDWVALLQDYLTVS